MSVFIFLSGKNGLRPLIEHVLKVLDRHLKGAVFYCVVGDEDAKKLSSFKTRQNTLELTPYSYSTEIFLQKADIVYLEAFTSPFSKADISKIKNKIIGHTTCEISGNNAAVDKAVQYVQSSAIKIEVLCHD